MTETEWRIARGWKERELEERLAAIGALDRNFEEPSEPFKEDWEPYGSEAAVAWEAPGPPEEAGAFRRLVTAVEGYLFSDPTIVEAHFDPRAPLRGRRMLLELKPLLLHYLCGAMVTDVQDRSDGDKTTWGFRYDTLEGHVEAGYEWFLLRKDHGTGEVRFTIAALWRAGDFPNWWSRVGFEALGRRYQRTWHERAHRRLTRLAYEGPLDALPPAGQRLVHRGPEVTFRRGVPRAE